MLVLLEKKWNWSDLEIEPGTGPAEVPPITMPINSEELSVLLLLWFTVYKYEICINTVDLHDKS